jgi:hypothetical protein
MTNALRELSIPPAALDDPESGELLRAWIANRGLHCSLNVHVWDDVGNWGVMLADLARHVANAKHHLDGSNPDEVIGRIRQLFDAELASPTDEPSGDFLQFP